MLSKPINEIWILIILIVLIISIVQDQFYIVIITKDWMFAWLKKDPSFKPGIANDPTSRGGIGEGVNLGGV